MSTDRREFLGAMLAATAAASFPTCSSVDRDDRAVKIDLWQLTRVEMAQ